MPPHGCQILLNCDLVLAIHGAPPLLLLEVGLCSVPRILALLGALRIVGLRAAYGIPAAPGEQGILGALGVGPRSIR